MRENDFGILIHCTNYCMCECVYVQALTNGNFTRLVVDKYQ